jgi:hypothetical protein
LEIIFRFSLLLRPEFHTSLMLVSHYWKAFVQSFKKENHGLLERDATIHIGPALMDSLGIDHGAQDHVVSTRRIWKYAGQSSGLCIRIREILTRNLTCTEYNNWWNAWLVLRPVSGRPEVFRIMKVRFRKCH